MTPQQSLDILHSLQERQQGSTTIDKQGVAEKGRYLDGVHTMLTWLSHFATPQRTAADASPVVSIGEQLQSLVDKHAKR